jgi:hypothetical protein
MRSLITTGLGLALLTGTTLVAQAANSPLMVWQGSITVTSATAQCSTAGIGEGDLLTSVYRPRLQPDEPNSALTVITGRSAQVFFRSTGNDQMRGKGNFSAFAIGSRGTLTSGFDGAYNFTVKPPAGAVTETTKAINISGSLTNYFNVAGCTVKFVGAYEKRP